MIFHHGSSINLSVIRNILEFIWCFYLLCMHFFPRLGDTLKNNCHKKLMCFHLYCGEIMRVGVTSQDGGSPYSFISLGVEWFIFCHELRDLAWCFHLKTTVLGLALLFSLSYFMLVFEIIIRSVLSTYLFSVGLWDYYKCPQYLFIFYWSLRLL
jgi:hypothetical protein